MATARRLLYVLKEVLAMLADRRRHGLAGDGVRLFAFNLRRLRRSKR
jgi:hypothetical protein